METVGTTRWDRAGAMRRARRLRGVSQRELADLVGVSRATIAAAESSSGGVSLGLVEAILAAAGLRLAVVDADGNAVAPMRAEAVRDRAGRHFPAHLHVQAPPLLNARTDPWRHDRPMPQATFLRRGTRPLRPALWTGRGPDRPIPWDHATAGELTEERQRQVRFRRRGPSRLDLRDIPDCCCGPECELHCVPGCPCQCEPDPAGSDHGS